MVEAKIDINTDDINEQSEDVTTKEMAEQQAAKRSRANEGDAVATNADGASPNVTDAANAPAEVMNSNPITVGYKKFASGSECYKYYHLVITKYRKNQNLNDYEFHNVMELIRVGHPEAERKLAAKVDAIQIRDVYTAGVPSCCFHLIRADGSTEDVSYRKCVAKLFPEMKDLVAHQSGGQTQSGRENSRRGRGRGRGRGRRGGGARGRR